MQDLIKRIGADGPSRELDAEIALALGWRQKCGSHWGIGAPHWWLGKKCNKDVIGYWDGHPSGTLPLFTSSIDAAMTLVPTKPYPELRIGEWWWMIEVRDGESVAHISYENHDAGIPEFDGCAATPALALCAAALRALQEV